MPTITSVSSNPTDAVQGTMWIIFNIDSAFTGSNINEITVTGDGRRSAVLHLNQALWLRVTNIPPSGTFTVTLATGALTPALDAEQSFKFTWTSRDKIWTVTELTGIPILTISPTSNSMDTGATQTITVTSSAALTTFDETDITVSAGTISGFTGSGTSYSFTLTAPASGSGTIHIDIPATSDWQAATRVSVTYAPPQPPQTPATVTLGRSAASIQSGQTATITATFNKAVTGIAANDFTTNRGTLSGFRRVSATVYRIIFTAPSSGTATATLTLRANAANEQNAAATITVAYAPPRQQPPPSNLSIEAIDEQTIPIFTEDYELEIDIGGAPTRAYVDGDMEGFYHAWDPDNARLLIKAIKVTRLISGAIWNVRLVKGTQTLNSQIVYNVVPSAPVIADPGAQKLYRGGSFGLDIAIANHPTLARGNSLLTGLKYQARADGVDGINLAGQFPAAANLTETTFNANIYTENDGGQDNLAVPITIETHTGVYVFDSAKDDLLKIGPDAATLQWTYDAPYPGHVRTGQRYDPIVASPDGIYLFSDVNDDLLKVSPDGDLLWTFEAETRPYEEMVVTESGVYVYWSGSIYKVHPATGALIWESDISYSRNNSQVYADDVYVLNQGTNILTKLNGEDGTVAWTYQAPSGYWLRGVTGDGAYLQSRLIFRKIDIETGMLAWMQTYAGTSANVTLNNDAVIIASATRRVQGSPVGPYRIQRINPANGATLWTSTVDFISYRVIDPDGFYISRFTTTIRQVLKLNLADGTRDWLVTLSDQSTPPIVQPKGIYILNYHTDSLIKLNKSNGSADWTVTVPRIRHGNLLIEDGSDIYAIASFGSGSDLVKLRVSDGSEQWRYASTTVNYISLAIPDFSLGV